MLQVLPAQLPLDLERRAAGPVQGLARLVANAHLDAYPETPERTVADMARPNYCRADETIDPCPDCGATVSGNDRVHGVCQARYPQPARTDYGLRLILVDRDTGKPI